MRTHPFSILIVVAAACSLCDVAAAAETPATADEALYAKSLARIPSADPAASNPPKVVQALRGVHPRLLFTRDELAALRTWGETDPLVAAACKDVTAAARGLDVPDDNRPKIVTGDHAAIVRSVGEMPALVYAYGLDRDPAIRKKLIGLLEVMLAQEHWAYSTELDCNMGAGNNMLMVGLVFDVVRDDLDPEFRRTMAAKMLTHVRRMYWLGHQQRNFHSAKYWQQDPQNNHRWHRNAGVAACLLAIADEEGIDCRWQLEQFRKEMDFILQWYPADGDCHEGPSYQHFGFMYLALTAKMSDRVLGTDYLRHPGFANAWTQKMHYWAPGRQGPMGFGDCANRQRPINHLGAAFFISPAVSRDENVQAMMKLYYDKMTRTADGGRRPYPWTLLACYDPTVKSGDPGKIPTCRLFADLGAATLRDSWADDAVLFTFKCGPYGGYRLNEYRHAHSKEGKPHYVNIAHDDPDANSFALGADGEFLFHPGNYAVTKTTDNHNTIVVDGAGQRGEGQHWMQPTETIDMRTLSYLTGWKADDAGRIIIEGEAGPAYEPLKRFRRTAVWMPGEYILVLDDVVADGSREVTWLGAVPRAEAVEGDGRWQVVTEGGRRMDVQVLASADVGAVVAEKVMDGRWKDLTMRQLRLAGRADAIKFACLMDPWNRGVTMRMTESADGWNVAVTAAGFEDVWTVRRADDLERPSSVVGRRDGRPMIALTDSDRAPRGDKHSSE